MLLEFIQYILFEIKQLTFNSKMSKLCLVYIFSVLIIVIVSGIDCDETYDGKYDNIDIDEILKNERLLTNYVNCLMEEGPCTEDGRELKGEFNC